MIGSNRLNADCARPGEHLVWRGDDGERRPAVVQSFNPHQRVADLLFMDSNEKQTVSVLELDPGGSGRTNFGVGYGQQVLLCTDNGAPLPEVPSLGQFETPIDNIWWRDTLAKLAERYAENVDRFEECLPEGKREDIKWWGEVVQLHLDGTVSVALPNGEQRRVGIKNVQLLNDPGADIMDGFGPMEGDDTEFVGEEDEAMIGSQASWETMSRRGSKKCDIDVEEEVMDIDGEEDEQDRLEVEEVEPVVSVSEWQQSNGHNSDDVNTNEAGPSSPNGHLSGKPTLKNDEHWKQFEVLEEAPQDHHFFREPRLYAASKTYHSRLQKEHRALMSSLPENILVRTYEDRTDLMRCLIIGPEGTPYADAPFVFDIYLNPTTFPQEPPIVHFHSHTNGKGRCNPNLYEDGKVCLSILGTWSGDKSESWCPAKSSLLQVFVSISGLVLVRSPYHCEPAFAKLEGTREGKVNSRLYSEKAYVLSRSFVRTALEHPPIGLEKEINHLYFQKGRLKAVIDHAKRLIDKGEAGGGVEDENDEMWNADAMGSLTMGAILTLKVSGARPYLSLGISREEGS